MDATHFNEALGDVKPAIGNQRPYVLLEVGDELAIRADDLHVGIATTVPTQGKSKAGKVLVPYAPLATFVAKSDAMTIDLRMDGDLLHVDDGAALCTLASYADEWFPTRPVVEGSGVTLSADEWARIRGLAQFCSPDASKGIYTGVEFNERGATATDSYTLAHVDHDFGVGRILPAPIVKAVAADGEVTVAGDGACTQIRSGNLVVSTAPLAGEFIDWRRAVPSVADAKGSFTVPTARFARAIDRAAVLAEESPSRLGKVVKLSEAGGSVVVESKPDGTKGDSRSMVTEVLEGSTVEGEWDVPFGVHTHQIGSVAAVLAKPDEITFHLFGQGQPIVVETDEVFIALWLLRLG